MPKNLIILRENFPKIEEVRYWNKQNLTEEQIDKLVAESYQSEQEVWIKK